MDIPHCDLCGLPIKRIQHLMFVIDKSLYDSQGNDNCDKFEKSFSAESYHEYKKDLCDTCYTIILTLFDEKKKALKALAKEIKRMYEMSESKEAIK